MKLTQEQQEIFDGKHGKAKAKVLKTLINYGQAFEAQEMIPVTGEYNHSGTAYSRSFTGAYVLLGKGARLSFYRRFGLQRYVICLLSIHRSRGISRFFGKDFSTAGEMCFSSTPLSGHLT